MKFINVAFSQRPLADIYLLRILVTLRDIIFVCDRRRLANAFLMSLFWVAFGFWGLDCLQNAVAKGTKRVEKGG